MRFSIALLVLQCRFQKLRLENETAADGHLIAGLKAFEHRSLAVRRFRTCTGRTENRSGAVRTNTTSWPSICCTASEGTTTEALTLPTGISAFASISGRKRLFGVRQFDANLHHAGVGIELLAQVRDLAGESKAFLPRQRHVRRLAQPAACQDLPAAPRPASTPWRDRQSRT